MKKVFQLLLLSVSCLIFKQASAQMVDPVHWSFHATKINDCEFELVIKANLDGNWHLYGQKKYGDDGPIPTTFRYIPNPNYELLGPALEETLIKKFDPVFKLELNYFEHEAFFKQRVKVKSDSVVEIKGDFEFMVCNEVTCMPPATVPFSFKVQGSKGSVWLNLLLFILFVVVSISFLGGFEIKLLSQLANKFKTVKIILGFLFLALALKFAANADMLAQAGLITREIFIAAWAVVFTLTGIYLLGGIKFSTDNVRKHVSVTQLFFAIFAFAFTAYLIPGLWGAPLKLVDAFIPTETNGECGFGK
jgi:hypothetical protein